MPILMVICSVFKLYELLSTDYQKFPRKMTSGVINSIFNDPRAGKWCHTKFTQKCVSDKKEIGKDFFSINLLNCQFFSVCAMVSGTTGTYPIYNITLSCREEGQII